jgi:16S rRNA (uracil1498-N3)-methyltransferase
VQNSEPPLDVTLLAGITKGEKMDQLVRAAVELGVKKIIPVLTARTVVQMPAAKREGKGRVGKKLPWQQLHSAGGATCRRFIPPGL